MNGGTQMKQAKQRKQSRFLYWLVSLMTRAVAKCVFHRRVLRNELKGAKGPFVVIANHQTKLDFVNLLDLAGKPMRFVISDAFYSTSPVQWAMDRLGMIPKQQFQTSPLDMRRMKDVINNGEGLAIYPAGLMCEDGLSTPIPVATYRFLVWLRADVYVARTTGTYFVRPKWAKRNRPGRTYMDVYKLFSAEELATTPIEQIRAKADEALLFDAYREQEAHRIKYKHGDDLEGLEHVLYRCPHCKSEDGMRVQEKRHLICTHCGFRHSADALGLLSNTGDTAESFRYASDWSRMIYEEQKRRIETGSETELSCTASVSVLDRDQKKYLPLGQARITLTATHFLLEGDWQGEGATMQVTTACFASLPFVPGEFFEIQSGDSIYRCAPIDGTHTMKIIHMVKAYYELHTACV